MTYPDPLEAAFLRLRHAADADEYVPMERVIDTVLARLAALRAENERLRETLQALVDEKLVCNVREGDGSYIDVSAWCRAVLNGGRV